MNDPYCLACLESNEIVIDGRDHYFSECVKVNEVWLAVLNLIFEVSENELVGTNILDLLTLNFPKLKNGRDSEIVWIIGTYIYEIWSQFHEKEVASVSKDKMFGFLKFKYRSYQYGSRPCLSIPALS